MKRIVDYLRPVAGVFRPPLEEETQMRIGPLDRCREALYQVQHTERTMMRILGGMARELVGEG
jgi:hypothetical protein